MCWATAWRRLSWRSGKANSGRRQRRRKSRKQLRNRVGARALGCWDDRAPSPAIQLLPPNLQMLLTEVPDRALAPDLHEVVVQPRPNDRADDGNQAGGPFLHDFGAGLGCDALDDSRHKLRHELLLQEFAADVDSGRAGRRDPQLGLLFLGVVGEAVDQAELLDHAQGEAG